MSAIRATPVPTSPVDVRYWKRAQPVAPAIPAASAATSAVMSTPFRISAAPGVIRAAAASSILSGPTSEPRPNSSGGMSSGACSHVTSAGMTSEAGPPPPEVAARMAATVSAAMSFGDCTYRCQPAHRVSFSMSEVRGASHARWERVWSPIKFSTGVCARLALCWLARLLANPGPRWNIAMAGTPATL